MGLVEGVCVFCVSESVFDMLTRDKYGDELLLCLCMVGEGSVSCYAKIVRCQGLG